MFNNFIVRGFCSRLFSALFVPAILAVEVALLAVALSAQINVNSENKIGSETNVPAGEPRDQPLQREQWFMGGRISPGESPAALRMRAHQQKVIMRAARLAAARASLGSPVPNAAAGSGPVWIPLGPAPLASDASGVGSQDYGAVSGRATAVAIDPADPSGNTVYIGGAYGGVWKSANAGSASPSASNVVWAPVTDDQATLAIGAIAVQPGNNNPANSLVLVGTGETNSSTDSYYGLGILRSADAGGHWTLISQTASGQLFAGLGFSKIAFSTANSSIVVAAATGTAQGFFQGLEDPAALNRGLYYSTDDGNTWSFAVPNDGSTAIIPESATSVVFNPLAGLFFAAIRFHGFYSSPDGINWSRLANQPGPGLAISNCPSTAPSPNCPIYRGEIAVVPGRKEMYVWYVDAADTDQHIWQSLDAGNSWTPINDTGITNCGDPFAGCGTQQGRYNLELAAVPNGGATDLYAGAINIYKCQINSAQPTCSGTGANQFLNLTHVYGCPPSFGSISRTIMIWISSSRAAQTLCILLTTAESIARSTASPD
jgi:hypothetical protein